MVLKSDEHAVGRLGDEVADETQRAGARANVEHAQSRDGRRVLGNVLMSEQLVTATDRQRRGAVREGRSERVSIRADEIGTHDVLTLVLTTTEEPEVGPVRVERHASGERAHFHGNISPARALRQREDVAAVTVDVHEVGVQVRDM